MFQIVEGEETVDGAKGKGKGQSMMVPAIVEKGQCGTFSALTAQDIIWNAGTPSLCNH